MSGQSWTPEPWRLNRIAETSVENSDGRGVAATGGFQDGTELAYLANIANARRIVDCVNALEGIRNPAAYIAAMRECEAVLRRIASKCTTRRQDVGNPTVTWMQDEAEAALTKVKELNND